jgi:hypothetical protein
VSAYKRVRADNHEADTLNVDKNLNDDGDGRGRVQSLIVRPTDSTTVTLTIDAAHGVAADVAVVKGVRARAGEREAAVPARQEPLDAAGTAARRRAYVRARGRRRRCARRPIDAGGRQHRVAAASCRRGHAEFGEWYWRRCALQPSSVAVRASCCCWQSSCAFEASATWTSVSASRRRRTHARCGTGLWRPRWLWVVQTLTADARAL